MQGATPRPTAIDADELATELAALHSVLKDGGLSGEMRARGADAVAAAQTLIAQLAEHNAALRQRAAAAEGRVTAAAAALSGSLAPVPPTNGANSGNE